MVHEAYLKLAEHTRAPLQNRRYFFGAAARAMRQVLVDLARRRRSVKRGEGRRPVPLDEAGAVASVSLDGFAAEILDLDQALASRETELPRPARVVECRFFAGLSVEETAVALDVSERTVKGDWALARAWLFRELAGAR